MSKKRRYLSAKKKASIALDALRERETGAALAARHGVHANQISQWKKQAQEGLESAFSKKNVHQEKLAEQNLLLDDLYQQIGRLQMEISWLKKKYEQS